MTKITPIIVIATWSSGSSAMTGFLDRCGAYTCPPHQKTSDEKTPIAYEPYFYADALRNLFDESTLKQKGKFEDFESFFEVFWNEECEKAQKIGCNHIALKHPLQTFILPYLNRRLNPKYLFVTRPIAEIEQTRYRRKWGNIYGAVGAKNVYTVAINFFIENSCAYLSVPYNKVIEDTNFRTDILNFCGLCPNEKMLKEASEWLRIN